MKPMNKIFKKASLAAICLTMASSATADINVAYFLEWATPNLISKVDNTYDEVLGEKVNWVNFSTGTAMTEAMLSGDIDISYSQGMTPFVTAINSNAPLKMIGIAVAYGPSDDCVVGTNSGISKENALELEGKSVAVPFNTMADFGFRMSMKSLGVDVSKIKLVDQEPADGAVSLADGLVAMTCGFGGAVLKMKEHGKSLLTAEEKVAAGITSFDIISVTEKFAQEKPELLKRFIEVTSQANEDYAKDQSKLDVIAKEAGLTLEKAKKQIVGLEFPTIEEQKKKYFSKDGLAFTMMPFMGKMFGTTASPAKEDYSKYIDLSFLE